MGNNNVDSATSSSKIVTDLKAFQKENPEAKNMKQLNTIFSAMDKDGSGKIEDGEGTLFYFSDGTVSATKCEKSVGDDGREIEHYKMFMGADDNGVYEYDSDGKVKKSIREQDDGSKFEFGYTKDNQLAYKKYTDTDGKEFLLSPTNKKVATIEKDGSIRTDFKTRDSFEGTMQDLGLDPLDTFLREEFEKANPDAKRAERFMPDVDNPSAMQVKIPKSILEKYEVVFYNKEIKLKPKADGAPKAQPWDKEDPNAARHEMDEAYAAKVADESSWVNVELHKGIPDPFMQQVPVQPVVKEEEMTPATPQIVEQAVKKDGVKNDFKNKLNQMNSGTDDVPNYTLDNDGNIKFEGGRFSMIDSSLRDYHKNSTKDDAGMWHRGPLSDADPNRLNRSYLMYTIELSKSLKVYQEFSKKTEPEQNEKAFMQKFEQEMQDFMNIE